MNFIFFVFNTLKALSYGFLLLVVVSTFFVHVFTAASRGL